MTPLITLFASALFSQASQPASQPSTNVPRVLERAFRERLSSKTAQFKIRREDHYVSMGQVPLVHHYEYRWSGESLQFTDYGDDDGVRQVDPRTGAWRLGLAYACLPESCLLDPSAQTLYTHHDSDAFVTLKKAKSWPTYVDIRTAGLRAIEVQRRSPLELLSMLNAGVIGYSQKDKENGIVCVTRTGKKATDGTGFEFEWEIDTKKDYSVLGVKEWFINTDGQRRLAFTCNTDVTLCDNHWWPARVEYVSLHSGNRSVITFEKVEFDRPTHPQKLTLGSMGIPIGAPVWGKDSRLTYIGTDLLLPEQDWKNTQDQFDLGPLRAWQECMKSMSKGELPSWWAATDANLGIEDVANQIDNWEAYVRRWVMRHVNNRAWVVTEPLTDSQKTAAHAVLTDCRGRAIAVRMRLEKERASLEAEIDLAQRAPNTATSQPALETRSGPIPFAAANSTSAKGGIENKARLLELRKKLDELKKTQEIPALFDELKRRLEEILTEKQRVESAGYLKQVIPGTPIK